MAFNAGAIEATLTLNRNPFTAGLAAARSQARSFLREYGNLEVTLKLKGHTQVEAQIARIERRMKNLQKEAVIRVRMVQEGSIQQARNQTATINQRVSVDNKDAIAAMRELQISQARVAEAGRFVQQAFDMENAAARRLAAAQERLNSESGDLVNNYAHYQQAQQQVRAATEAHEHASSELAEMMAQEARAARELAEDQRRLAAVQAAMGGRTTGGTVTQRVVADTTQAEQAMNGFYQRHRDRRIWIPVQMDITQAENANQRLRIQLANLQTSARIQPRFEERLFMDQYGNMRTRMVKISQDHGTFMAEGMSSRLIAGFVRTPFLPMIAPVLLALGAIITSGVFVGIPAAFGKLAFDIQSKLGIAKIAVENFNTTLNTMLQQDTSVLNDNFARLFVTLTQAANNVRPLLQSIFRDMQPMVDRASASINVIASQVFPALAANVRNAYPAVEGFFDGVELAANGVRRFFDEINSSAPAAGNVFRMLGMIVQDLGTFLGRLGASVTSVIGNQIWQVFASVLENVFDVLGRIVQAALPGFGAGLQVALTVINGLLAVVRPFSDIIGTWVGVLAGVAIAFRGLSMAGGLVVTMLGLLRGAWAATAITTFAIQIGAASLALQGFLTRAGAAPAIVNGVATATTGLVGGLTALARFLPVVGLALVAVVAGYDAMTTSASEAAQSVVNSEQTMQAAIATRAETIERTRLAVSSLAASEGEAAIQSSLWAAQETATAQATREVAAEVEAYLGTLPPLQAATERVRLAEEAYVGAVQQFGPASAQAQAALATLEGAKRTQESVTRAQEQAEVALQRALTLTTEAIFAQQAALVGGEAAQLAFERQVLRTNEALGQHSASSLEGRDSINQLQQSALRNAEAQVTMARDVAEARGQILTAAEAARTKRQALLDMASSASGPARSAVLGLIQNMINLGDKELEADVKARGLTGAVNGIPNSKNIQFSTPGLAQARGDVDGFKRAIDNIPNEKSVRINSYVVQPLNPVTSAMGNYLRPMAEGGVLEQFARGGLKPMSGRVASMVKANTWRVIGDRMMGDEAFIPINRSARSQSILQTAAQRMGFNLIPKLLESNVQNATANVGIRAPQMKMPAPNVEVRAGGDGSGITKQDLVAMAGMIAQQAGGKDVTVNFNGNTYNPIAEPEVSSKLRQARDASWMGIFQ